MKEVGAVGAFGFGGVGVELAAAGGSFGGIKVWMKREAKQAALVIAAAADNGEAAGSEIEKGGRLKRIVFDQANEAFVGGDEEAVAGIAWNGDQVERLGLRGGGDGGDAEEVGLQGAGGNGIGLGENGWNEEERRDGRGEDDASGSAHVPPPG